MTHLKLVSAETLAGVLLAGLVQLACAQSVTRDRPNIVLILSDDMGYSDIGCYGGEIRTPHIDRLAAGGLRFTQFYNTGRCCPTRASLLTGLYPHQAGVGHMTGAARDAAGNELPGYHGDLNQGSLTIAEVLRTTGYRTYMAGKWHVARGGGPAGPKLNWPVQRGFEKFYGTIGGAGSYFDPASLCRQETFVTPFNDPQYQPEQYYYTDAIADNALAYLRQHNEESAEQPFFLYVAFTASHWPLHALPEDIQKYQGLYSDGYAPVRESRLARLIELGLVPSSCRLSPQAGAWAGIENKKWEAKCMEVYAAMADRMDQGIGRLVAQLQKTGDLENTLILYLQDNGGCAETLGRQEPGDWGNHEKWVSAGGDPMGNDELQRHIWPPMRTRAGKPLLGGPETMPGPDGTYLSYGLNWANVSNTPFREYKHYVHEGGIATPLVVHWPAVIREGHALRRQPGHLIDIMATCVEISDAVYPTEWKGHQTTPPQGCSLVPAFADEPLPRESLFWEHEGNCAIRTGNWKLVRKGARGEWELYDLTLDRSETLNLAAEYPDRVSHMASEWEAWAVEALVKPWPWRR